MFRRGFKLGMLLQLMVGPISLLVFKTAGAGGLRPAFAVVLAVTLADAAFIAAAGAGTVYFLSRPGVQETFRIISCVVLVLFGIHTVLSVFGLPLLPEIRMFSGAQAGNAFLQGIVLSVSNPLTVLFWNSLFAAESARHRMTRRHMFLFGAGCVLSTVVFLSFVAAVGNLSGRYLPETVTGALNIVIGLALIGYGIALLAKRKAPELSGAPKG